MTRKIRIMIVEDEVLIAEYLKLELELEFYEVCAIVTTGEEAVITSAETLPDVILMDICLAGEIDGIDAAIKIQSKEKIPIIFMTGYSREEFIDRMAGIRHLSFLNKPVEVFDIKPLIETIT